MNVTSLAVCLSVDCPSVRLSMSSTRDSRPLPSARLRPVRRAQGDESHPVLTCARSKLPRSAGTRRHCAASCIALALALVHRFVAVVQAQLSSSRCILILWTSGSQRTRAWRGTSVEELLEQLDASNAPKSPVLLPNSIQHDIAVSNKQPSMARLHLSGHCSVFTCDDADSAVVYTPRCTQGTKLTRLVSNKNTPEEA